MFRCATPFAATVILIASNGAIAEDAGITVTEDVPYGDHQQQQVDIYTPATVGPGTPIVVFFHGGAWRYGDKADLSEHGRSFAESGVVFVSANYRLYPDAVFPGFAEDSAAAVALAVEAFPPIDGEIHPLFLSGWSAGAYNAALLTYDEHLLAQHGVPAGTVTGFIGLSGPYEGGFCAGARCEKTFPEELRGAWHVAGHVDGDDPDALLIAGETDSYVPARHHEDLADAIERAGGAAQVHVVPWGSHSSTQRLALEEGSEVRTLIDSFIAAASPLSLRGCPALPVSADGLGLTLTISENGAVSECKIGKDVRCGRVFDPREGFLCISVDADARPTLTQIEGPESQRVDRVVVDGVEYREGAVGYPHLHLRDVIATGPSGSPYDIVVQTSVGNRTYTTTLKITADLERPLVTFEDLTILPRGISR